MLFLSKENIFNNTTAEWLVNPVNIIGIMGKGLAFEMKKKFPDMFDYYQNLCQQGMMITDLFLHKYILKEPYNNFSQIILFPTKKHWRDPSKYEYIKKGLQAFTNTYNNEFKSTAMPMLGCGCGGLDEKIVFDMLCNWYLTLHDYNFNLYLHVSETFYNGLTENGYIKKI